MRQESRNSISSSTEVKEKHTFREPKAAGLLEVQGRWKREEDSRPGKL